MSQLKEIKKNKGIETPLNIGKMEKTGNSDKLSKEWSTYQNYSKSPRLAQNTSYKKWKGLAHNSTHWKQKKPLLSKNNTKARLKIGHPLIKFVVHSITSATKITAFNFFFFF